MRHITRTCAAAAAGIALSAVGVTGASASAARTPRAVTATGSGPSLAAASSGAQLWAERYDNRGNGGADSAAVSRNGSTVFVTGYSVVQGGGDYATIAYQG